MLSFETHPPTLGLFFFFFGLGRGADGGRAEQRRRRNLPLATRHSHIVSFTGHGADGGRAEQRVNPDSIIHTSVAIHRPLR